ncbi:MAG: DUF3568 family protein [Rhodospirillales bacterium]|nr:DUF3568 family protein [Rhodospirillales bacterium]MBO6787813.1 DUF3568 family protein [Rhodospirillales bacterium]
MRKFTIIMIAAMALTLQGCAGVGLTMLGIGAGTATSAGVNHTLSGIAYKTFTAELEDVRKATRNALAVMAMDVQTDKKTQFGYMIEAKARERTAEIQLQELTRATTRMRVTVIESDGFFRDSATSTEIIIQTAQNIDAQVAEKQ